MRRWKLRVQTLDSAGRLLPIFCSSQICWDFMFQGQKEVVCKPSWLWKKLCYLQGVTREGWIFVWFSLSKFPSYLKGDPSPPLIIDMLLLTRPVVAGFEVSRFVLSASCFVLIGEQIVALSKGFLVGQSAYGHLIILECVQVLDHASLHIPHPVCTALIWVKYSQNNKDVEMTSSGATRMVRLPVVVVGGVQEKKMMISFIKLIRLHCRCLSCTEKQTTTTADDVNPARSCRMRLGQTNIRHCCHMLLNSIGPVLHRSGTALFKQSC